jgi:transposase-like protein
MLADLDQPKFKDDDAARAYLESVHWPDGPICPHCGERERVTRLHGKAHRAGVVQCNNCREQFTVTIGTVMERSKIPLHKWVLAMHLLCASKKGMSAHQLHRMLGVTYQTAWFLAHRLRAAMADPKAGPLGGEGKTVEADETYFGEAENPNPRNKYLPPKLTKAKRGPSGKRAIVALVERGGKAKTFHVQRADSETVKRLLRTTASRKSELMTDESRLYTDVGTEYARHGKVKHSVGEYVDWDDPTIHTNTVEGYFSVTAHPRGSCSLG